MHPITMFMVFNTFFWMIKADDVSVLSATFDTPESGLIELRRWQPAKSKLACGASCLRTTNCTGFQIEEDTGGKICILSKNDDDDSDDTTCSEDSAYLINYMIVNNSKWISPDYAEASQMDLREQCFPSIKMENSLSHDKFVGYVWIFSNTFGKAVCRVTTISEIQKIYDSGICNDTQKTPFSRFPNVPDGEVTFVIGINRHATLFTSTGKYVIYKYDGSKFKAVTVSLKPPPEYEMVTSAVIIKGLFILHLKNGTYTCYTQDKYLKWCKGNNITWVNSLKDTALCTAGVDQIQESVSKRLSGQIIGMTRIFRTYLIASNGTLTCQFNLNTLN